MTETARDWQLSREADYWLGRFSVMASPCEVLMEVDGRKSAQRILEAVVTEAVRIERKFSRYLTDNIIFAINHADGKPVSLDEESARLISFADELYRLSDGLFDITSGVLRRLWKFDGSERLPEAAAVRELLKHIGWQKVSWDPSMIILPAGMEIDLGGIGKEYAVDRCVQISRQLTDRSILVNFGGDLATSARRNHNAYWSVGRIVTGAESSLSMFRLYQGAIATSGDAHRYLVKDGVRYSHILNPRTGWPVADAPHTVSVAAPTCLEAGMMTTLAMLQGGGAEAFLRLQGVDFWIN